jgi:hypothetical protein
MRHAACCEKGAMMAKNAPTPPRSPKAGRPPTRGPVSTKRRGKRARAALRKDTMILEASRGPRVLWGRARPKVKKG